MRYLKGKISTCLLMLAGNVFLNLNCLAQNDTSNQITAFTGAKIYTDPSANAIENGIVLVENGKIRAVGASNKIIIPKKSKIIDCRGLVMMAAFWNCHVHFIEAKWQQASSLPTEVLNHQLRDMVTSRGFAHVFDLATLDTANLLALRRRINNNEVLGPDLFIVGMPFAPPNGSPSYIAPQKIPEIGGVSEAVSFVKEQIASGADAIKVWSASPAHGEIVKMPLIVLKAAVKEAHQMNKQVFAHPSDNDGVSIAIEGGVDILAHVSPDYLVPWSDSIVHAMLGHHMALIPTLKLFKWSIMQNSTASSHDKDTLITTALQQLGSYAKAGGEILFGTDVGFMNDYTTEDEFDLMAKAGLSFRQILASLTTAPAMRFHLSRRTGKILPGMDADIVLLDQDPGFDSKAFSHVSYTIRKGRILYSRAQKESY
jgi:imidazolonepropionase-like amidohydrolase